MDSASSLRNKERLGCRRERERAHCAKTAEEKERRLRQQCERDRARRAAQSVEERDVRLHRKSTAKCERSTTETDE